MADFFQNQEEIWGDNLNKVTWQPEHFKILDKINVDFDVNGEMTDDQVLELDDKVYDYFAMHGIGKNDDVTPTGRICESILGILSDL